jgi:hypothetical protein
MNAFLSNVYDPAKVDTMASVIEPAMQEDPAVPYDAWQATVTEMREFIETHRDQAQAQVDAECN